MQDLGDNLPAIFRIQEREMIYKDIFMGAQTYLDDRADRGEHIDHQDFIFACLNFTGGRGSAADIAAKAVNRFDE